jgi:hypothetical protein
MGPGVDYLSRTYNPEHMRYSRGQPVWGLHFAEELERLVALHDASTIAAVILEPMQGSTGVLVPPKGYLQRIRLRSPRPMRHSTCSLTSSSSSALLGLPRSSRTPSTRCRANRTSLTCVTSA